MTSKQGHMESLVSYSIGFFLFAIGFNGPPDPLHGDAPYVNVREAAGVCLLILMHFPFDWLASP